MDSRQFLKTAVFAGSIMLSSGAETHRVEDTMCRILEKGGFKTIEAFVTTTGIFATIEDEKDGMITIIKRITKRTYNLGKVAMVNSLSREFVENKITIEETMKFLQKIDELKGNSFHVQTIASGVSCFCFAYMFGGNIAACSNALIIGVASNIFQAHLRKKEVSSFLINIFSGCIITIIALCFSYLKISSLDYLDKVIIGSIMPLLPGVSITNAIRDVLGGDFLSGTSRIVDATLVAVCIASGVGFVLKTWFWLFGGAI